MLDLAGKEIVGYALAQKTDAKLVNKVLLDALKKKQSNTCKLIFHSDQGIQYSTNIFRN